MMKIKMVVMRTNWAIEVMLAQNSIDLLSLDYTEEQDYYRRMITVLQFFLERFKQCQE